MLISDIIDTIEKENLVLKKRNIGLQEQVTLLEKAVQNLTIEKQSAESKAEKRENITAGNIHSTSYGVYISQLICFASASSYVTD